MKESIYTIPISEVFEPRCGCPICSMRTTLETRCIEYILGAAMMEPDVRIETNCYGFCGTHYAIMQQKNNKLSLALMLESHMAELLKQKPQPPAKSKNPTREYNCFVCKEIDEVIYRLAGNVVAMYNKDSDFRRLFAEQEYFCWPHYRLLCDAAYETLGKRNASVFIDTLAAVARKRMEYTLSNVHEFTQMFDYRNASKEKTPEVAAAIENAIKLLT